MLCLNILHLDAIKTEGIQETLFGVGREIRTC